MPRKISQPNSAFGQRVAPGHILGYPEDRVAHRVQRSPQCRQAVAEVVEQGEDVGHHHIEEGHQRHRRQQEGDSALPRSGSRRARVDSSQRSPQCPARRAGRTGSIGTVGSFGGLEQIGTDIAAEFLPYRLHRLAPVGACCGLRGMDLAGATGEDALAGVAVEALRPRGSCTVTSSMIRCSSSRMSAGRPFQNFALVITM